VTVKDTPYQDAALSARQARAIGIKTLQEWTTEAGETGREELKVESERSFEGGFMNREKDNPCLEYYISLNS